jgi:hypothetical protein
MRARQRHFNPRDAGATIALDSRYGFNQSDGTAVSTWDDRTRTNNDGTQATAASQPTYETNETGGQPAIRFDGINDFLSFTTSNFTYTSGASVFAVIKPTSESSGFGSVISEFDGAGKSIGCQPSVFPNNAIEPSTDVFGPGGIRRNSTVTNSTWFICGWHWSNWSTHKTNGNTRISVNGEETLGAAYGSNPSGFTSTTKSIGRFEATTNTNNFLQADIALISAMPAIELSLRKRLYHAAAFSFKIACN